MPLYDFRCDECQHTFEQLVRRESEIPTVTCPNCASANITRALSLPAAPLTTTTSTQGNACGMGPPCGAPWCQRQG